MSGRFRLEPPHEVDGRRAVEALAVERRPPLEAGTIERLRLQDAAGDRDPVMVQVAVNRALYRRFRRFCHANGLEPPRAYLALLLDAALRQDDREYVAHLDPDE